MNISEYAQRRIERERVATMIALLLFRYRSVSWSPTNIIRHVSADSGMINDALEWLKRKNYVNGVSVIFLTITGSEFVDGLKRNVSVASASSESKFKSEALSGMVEIRSKTGHMITEQSTMSTAVLPRAHAPVTKTTPEDLMVRQQKAMQSRAAVASRLGISETELINFIEENRVRYCKSCNKLGLFDKKGADRWHSVCRKCRKKNRYNC